MSAKFTSSLVGVFLW